MKTFRNVVLTSIIVVILLPSAAEALRIVPVFDTFNPVDQQIIDEAIREWMDRLPCNDGLTTTITFICNNTMTDLGLTGAWVWDAQGRPTSATVSINNNRHNWTLGNPLAGFDDALDTLKHEIGHAIGFTVNGANFAARTLTDVNGNRFFDRNGDGNRDAGIDFDLSGANEGTHAPAGSDDLMQPTTPPGQRHHPTIEHAMVLADAYGYCPLFQGLDITLRQDQIGEDATTWMGLQDVTEAKLATDDHMYIGTDFNQNAYLGSVHIKDLTDTDESIHIRITGTFNAGIVGNYRFWFDESGGFGIGNGEANAIEGDFTTTANSIIIDRNIDMVAYQKEGWFRDVNVEFWFTTADETMLVEGLEVGVDAQNVYLLTPEPWTVVMIGTGLVALAGIARKRLR